MKYRALNPAYYFPIRRFFRRWVGAWRAFRDFRSHMKMIRQLERQEVVDWSQLKGPPQ